MMMHFSALRGINRTAWGIILLLTAVLAHPVDCTSFTWSHTEGTALLLESKWLLWPAFSFPPAPTRPPSIDSIHDITGSEKIYPKNQHYTSSL